MRVLLIIVCIALPLCAAGQYTYFNETQGELGDEDSEFITNIEVVNDDYYTWGAGSFSGLNTELIKVIDENGEPLDERDYVFFGESVFPGGTNSFKEIPETSEFLFSHGTVTTEGTKGILVKFTSDLDTLWKKHYAIYDDYTYFYTHAWDGDGFVLAGEYGLGPGQRGTFIAKVDEEGELLWNEVIHEPNEGAFRNTQISVLPDGYLLTGASGGGIDTEGYLEKVSSNGDIIWRLEGEGGLRRGTMTHLMTSDDRILVAQSIAYEDYPFSTNPINAYFKMRLHFVDTATHEFVDVVEHFVDYEWERAGALKIVEDPNGGYILTGPARVPVGEELRSRSFVMKVNTDLQQEWYTELFYEDCFGCTNELFDLERAPDGGYVMVGKVDNPEDPRDRSWIVKVDACGDLEYNGCAAVGLSELRHNPEVTIYPNPASEHIFISIDDDAALTRVALYDLAGREIMSTSDVTLLDVSALSAGVYMLQLLNGGALVHSERVVVR